VQSNKECVILAYTKHTSGISSARFRNATIVISGLLPPVLPYLLPVKMLSNSKSLLIVLQIIPTIFPGVEAAWGARPAANHVANHRRQASATQATTYTVITPSPSAEPVAVTSLSQVVTSYVPLITACAIAGSSVSPVISKWSNSSTNNALALRSVSSSDCTTQYSSTLLTICATTLQGLGSTVSITACDQRVTFSSEYGYSLIPASTTTSSFDGTGAPETTITAPASINTITVCHKNAIYRSRC